MLHRLENITFFALQFPPCKYFYQNENQNNVYITNSKNRAIRLESFALSAKKNLLLRNSIFTNLILLVFILDEKFLFLWKDSEIGGILLGWR